MLYTNSFLTHAGFIVHVGGQVWVQGSEYLSSYSIEFIAVPDPPQVISITPAYSAATNGLSGLSVTVDQKVSG